MFKRLFALSIAMVSIPVGSAVFAAQVNHSPVCPAKIIILKGLPSDADISAIEIDPIAAAPSCTDADGDTLTLISTSIEAQLNAKGKALTKGKLKAGQSNTVTFTVSDGKGGITTGILTITR